MKTAGKLTALALAAMLAAGLVSCGDSAGSGANHDFSKGLDENGHFQGIKASEIIELPEYKGIDADSDVASVSQDEIDAQIDYLLSYYGYYEQIRNRAVADGDTVNIDYVGSIDGVQFDGGNTGGLGTTVTIGVTNYVEGFLVQLIGRTPGESFDIKVTFPEDYGSPELNGKDAVFAVTINYIQGEYITPVLTDAIAIENGYENIAALLEDIEKDLAGSEKFYFLTDLLADAVCEQVPQEVIDYLINYQRAQIESDAAMYGMTVDEMANLYYGVASFDEYIEANMEGLTDDAVLYLAVQAIAEIEGLSVSAEDIAAAGYTEYVEMYGEPYIKQFMLFQEVVPQFVIDNANLVDGLDAADTEAAE